MEIQLAGEPGTGQAKVTEHVGLTLPGPDPLHGGPAQGAQCAPAQPATINDRMASLRPVSERGGFHGTSIGIADSDDNCYPPIFHGRGKLTYM